jgi:hypothetical protein
VELFYDSLSADYVDQTVVSHGMMKHEDFISQPLQAALLVLAVVFLGLTTS